MPSSISVGVKRSAWTASPVNARARALARARPSGSSSPRWATVCWTTLRPTRTERTRRQYRWTLPSFRRVVGRRYIVQLIRHPPRRSQRTWSALHRGFFSGGRRRLQLHTARPRIAPCGYPGCGSWASRGLLSYFADNAELIRRTAVYVGKILKGAKHADI